MTGQDVFISYKSEEFPQAERVRQRLEQAGISCWMAPASITGGSSYASEIPQAIRSCKVFVLLLSRRAQKSMWIPKELDRAINSGAVIMPLMLEDCPLEDEFSFYLANIQRYPAYQDPDAAMTRLLQDIRLRLGRPEPAPAPLPEPARAEPPQKAPRPKKRPRPGTPGRKKHRLLKALGTALLALACAAILYVQANTVTIAGIRYSTHASSLRLTETELQAKDLQRLTRMKQLHILTLEACSFACEDLTGLASPTVWKLALPDCTLTGAQAESLDLTRFPALTTLDISGITALQQLPPLPEKVSILNISRTGITTLDGLEPYTSLTQVQAAGLPVSDLSPLTACTRLAALNISDTHVNDLTPLGSCPQLEYLWADRTPLGSFAGLEPCIELVGISARDARLTSLDGLQNTTLLEYVQLSGNPLQDAFVLAGSRSKLRRLYLDDTGLTGLDWLQGAASLEYLSVNGNTLQTLDFLSDSLALRGLSAAGNALTSAAVLADLPALQQVVLRDNALSGTLTLHLTGTSPLLDLRANPVTGLALTMDDARLRLLDISGTGITDFGPLSALHISRCILTYQDALDWDALAGLDCSSYTVLDCPLDQQVAVRTALSGRTEYASDLPEQSSSLLQDYLQGSTGLAGFF